MSNKLTVTYQNTPIINEKEIEGNAVVSYKGSTVQTVSPGEEKTLNTKDKYTSDFITIAGIKLNTKDKLIEDFIQIHVETGAPVPEGATFNDCSWANIKAISDYGTAASTWNVGDCKEVTLNGPIGNNFTASNLTTYMFIIGFDHDINTELPGGHTITLQGFKSSLSDSNTYALVDKGYNNDKTNGKWFNMKNSNSNSGGWESSLMRANIMPAFIAALPSDMQSVLKTVTKQYIPTHNVASVSTCQDKAFLLAESEIFGGIKNAITSEGSQYAWFLNKGITTSTYSANVRYRFNTSGTTTLTCFWWERSPHSGYSGYFCAGGTAGGSGGSGASRSLGFTPAVCV